MTDGHIVFDTPPARQVINSLEIAYFQQFAGFDIEPPERPCPPTLYEVDGFSVYYDTEENKYIVDSPASDPIFGYWLFADAMARADREAVWAAIRSMQRQQPASEDAEGGAEK